MTRVTKPVDERRAEILTVAEELFFREGFDKTQTADIAAKMGVASGLIYHYFPSKTELLYAVIDKVSEKKFKKLKALVQNYPGTAKECLIMLFSSHMMPPPPENGEIAEMPSFIKDPATINYCKRKMVTNGVPITAELIELGNKDGSWHCEHPEETANFIIQAVGGLMDTCLDANDINEAKSKMEIYKNITLRLLGV